MSYGRSVKCDGVLKQHGLEHCSMAVIGADRDPDDGAWRVMVTGDTDPEYLDLAVATRLAVDLERVGEAPLATRLSRAVETAKRQMQPRG